MPKVLVEKLTALTGHKDCVYTLSPSTEDHLFFSGAGDGMVVEWNLLEPGQGRLLAKVNASVYALCYVPEQKILVIGQNYDGVHIVDLQARKAVGSVSITDKAIFDIAYYQGLLIVCTGGGEIIVVDPQQRSVVKRIAASAKSARCVALHPERAEMAVGFSDHSIQVFDLQHFKPLYKLEGHNNSVFTLRYTPNGNFLVSGSRDANLRFWDTANGYALDESIVAHMYAINHLTFSPDGRYMATCSMDKSIKVWLLAERKLIKVIDKARHAGHGTSVNKLWWSAHHGQLISASDDRSISVWNLDFESI